ncbi:MAG: polyprenyl diphosphate synthase [Candidatus Paceibacterota bacterium]
MKTNSGSLQCVGFIMDGNRRFAKAKGEETLAGHLAGKEKFKEVIDWVIEASIPHAVFYAFSTENWKRSADEIEYLLGLLMNESDPDSNYINKNVRLRTIGDIDRFPKLMQARLRKSELETAGKRYVTTVWLALSYGGRAEIVKAVNLAIKNGEPVTEKSFHQLLETREMPDPDLIIRTGGEQRLSNFLPWQSIYSELFFVDTYWPAFTKDEFQRILSEYAKRERRLGR